MMATAPGKLILAGEYAAIFGYPAIAVAVKRYIRASLSPYDKKEMLQLELAGKKLKTMQLPLADLLPLYQRLTANYQQFCCKDLPIQQVVSAPYELILFNLAALFDQYSITPATGLKLTLTSDLPIGCGMGSSAALALSVLRVTADYYKLALNQDEYFALAMQSEQIQHGYPSGLDAQTSLYGNGWRLQQGQASVCISPTFPLYIVDTGKPQVSTGECVDLVCQRYGRDHPLWQVFQAVAEQLYATLIARKPVEAFIPIIQQQHALLVKIGVVPPAVQHFISAVEQQGGAAKTCGAGAVQGEQAGIIWLVSESPERLSAICAQFGYQLQRLEIDTEGLRAVL